VSTDIILRDFVASDGEAASRVVIAAWDQSNEVTAWAAC